MASDTRHIAVVGAGLAGCLLATLLARRGLTVTVYERRADPRITGAERGRSINLAISARGLDALERVGLREQSLGRALPMHGRMVHPVHGEESFRPYSSDGSRAINSISRSELNQSLLDAAEATPGVSVVFSHRLTELDTATGRLVFDTPDGPSEDKADLVLASDGAYSAVRRTIQFIEGFNFAQDFLEHGYKELTIPARDGDFALNPDALHIWPRGSSMMIALPNLDRSFTCTLFWPKNGADSFAALDTDEKVLSYFRRHYPDVVDLMPALLDDYRYNPIGSLVTVRCWPWVSVGTGCTVALVGDAAHAIVPFFGQGANCAFEDCIEIDRCLEESDGNWQRALAVYQQRRKDNTDAIGEMALENFVEMRDKVNSRLFQLTRAAEHAVERRLGGRYLSRYELVSFTTTPYSEIAGRLRVQRRALAACLAAGVLGIGVVARAVSARKHRSIH
jgi:kynurenine 3-monooxygenase